MGWTQPKTDWVREDYFNIEDYNRIVGNLLYLQPLVDKLFKKNTWSALVETKSYTDLFYADEMNAIENNLDAIAISTSTDIGKKKSFVANGTTPTFTEFNRIESALETLHEIIMSKYASARFLGESYVGETFGLI